MAGFQLKAAVGAAVDGEEEGDGDGVGLRDGEGEGDFDGLGGCSEEDFDGSARTVGGTDGTTAGSTGTADGLTAGDGFAVVDVGGAETAAGTVVAAGLLIRVLTAAGDASPREGWERAKRSSPAPEAHTAATHATRITVAFVTRGWSRILSRLTSPIACQDRARRCPPGLLPRSPRQAHGHSWPTR